MHTSFLTRSAVAVASLAVGSVALAAAPAQASASDVDRAEVLRVIINAQSGDRTGPATLALVDKVCDVTGPTGHDVELRLAYRTDDNDSDGNVAGFVVQAYLEPDSGPARTCTFAAFASFESGTTLSGKANITVDEPQVIDLRRAAAAPSHDFTLSGDFFVTPPVADIGYGDNAVATAVGESTTVQAATTTTSRVSSPKSTKVKKAARKTYNRTIATAQKKLRKSLDRAGSSTSKKKAARAAYSARKKAAKATLHRAWDSNKTTIVTTVPTSTTRAPFSLTTGFDLRLPF